MTISGCPVEYMLQVFERLSMGRSLQQIYYPDLFGMSPVGWLLISILTSRNKGDNSS